MDTQIDKDLAIKAIIDSIDLSQIIERMIKACGWSKRQAAAASQQYKNFLFLKRKYQNYMLPPSVEIDEVWHNHILHSEKYFDDCHKIFGSYLHHYPQQHGDAAVSQNAQKIFESETQALYFKEFGDYLYEVRANLILLKLKNFVKVILRKF